MIARTHNIIAFASLLTAAIYFPQKDLNMATIAVSLIANTAGSMLPDIDQASNKLWDMLPFGDNVGKVFSKTLISHRSISHSLLGFFIFEEISQFLLPKILNGDYINSAVVFVSLVIGYISHLFADSLTEEGLPPLFPWGYRFGFPPIKSWRIKSGHWFEKLIITPGVVIYLLWLGVNHWNQISVLF